MPASAERASADEKLSFEIPKRYPMFEGENMGRCDHFYSSLLTSFLFGRIFRDPFFSACQQSWVGRGGKQCEWVKRAAWTPSAALCDSHDPTFFVERWRQNERERERGNLKLQVGFVAFHFFVCLPLVGRQKMGLGSFLGLFGLCNRLLK